MNVNKSLLVASAVAVLGLGSLVALRVTPTHAAADGTSLIDRLAERFNLNRDEVQTVFTEHQSTLVAEHEQVMQDRLSQAITDGKLTPAQAELLTAKHTEMRAFHESLQDMTEEERREAMASKMDELKQWSEDNDLPMFQLHLGMPGGHGQFRGHMGMPFHGFDK